MTYKPLFQVASKGEARSMKRLLLLLVLSASLSVTAAPVAVEPGTTPPLVERLGYKSTDKLLIVNVDDIGNSHAANAAVIDAMENGLDATLEGLGIHDAGA